MRTAITILNKKTWFCVYLIFNTCVTPNMESVCHIYCMYLDWIVVAITAFTVVTWCLLMCPLEAVWRQAASAGDISITRSLLLFRISMKKGVYDGIGFCCQCGHLLADDLDAQ